MAAGIIETRENHLNFSNRNSGLFFFKSSKSNLNVGITNYFKSSKRQRKRNQNNN